MLSQVPTSLLLVMLGIWGTLPLLRTEMSTESREVVPHRLTVSSWATSSLVPLPSTFRTLPGAQSRRGQVMQRFFYFSAGVLCLSLAALIGFHVGVSNVQAQGGADVSTVSDMGGGSFVYALDNGDVFRVLYAPAALQSTPPLT